jgi:hypothetical protein
MSLPSGILVAKRVPALVCARCGDAWVDEPVAARLEGLVADARRKNTQSWNLRNGSRLRPEVLPG